jgi:hypothetical protein
MDETSLLLWAERQRRKARGRSKTQWLNDLDRAGDVHHFARGQKAPPLASYFANTDADSFIDLPPPVSIEAMCSVIVSLDEFREAFQARLNELKATGHAEWIEMAEIDLKQIDAASQAFEEVVCCFTHEVPRHLWEAFKQYA